MTMLEDRLRSHFQAAAAEVQAPPLDSAFPARRAHRRRQNRLGALAVVAVLGVGGIGVALSAIGSDDQGGTRTVDQPDIRDDEVPVPPSPEPDPTTADSGRSEPRELDVSSTVTVFDYSDDLFADLASADGSVWTVSPASEQPGRVTRIDAETGEVIARIALPGGARTFGVLASAEAVWVACSEGFIHRIDPSTNAVVASVRVTDDQPEGWFGDGAATADGVWISQYADARVAVGTENTNLIRRVDPASNSVVASIPVEGAFLDSPIAVGGGAVWVEAGSNVGRVDRIDPESNEVVASVFSPEPFREVVRSVIDVVADGDRVWMIGTSYAARIDPATNDVAATVTLPGAASGAVLINGFLLVGSEGRTLYRIDTSTMLLDAVIDLGPDAPDARHLAVTDGYLWFDSTPYAAGPETRIGRVPLDALTAVAVE